MRRIALPILSLLAVACSSEIDEVTFEEINEKVSSEAYNDETAKENNSAEDVDEMALLTSDQKELIFYFQYLTLWKGPHVTEIDKNRKWTTPMILHLDGMITDEYRETVESVISQYNTLFTESDFRITLTEDPDDANASLFFGTKEDVAVVWPDMYAIIKKGNYDGYAKTSSQNSIITATRIWISNPIGALFKHEMGHALGFGHSNHCEGKKSIMCSTVSAASAILPMEANVIRYQYHRDLPHGLSETEIEEVLANIILNER
ncbi:hypothetical protein [Pricia sp.]|uniref:hypothetical protein n=1 Tax=Pricia sp. TaxID=2268138 RepID=UPI0035948089